MLKGLDTGGAIGNTSLMTTNPIDNRDDIIDSRDVIARIAELGETAEAHDEDPDIDGLDDDERAELAALVALADEGESLSDWTYGVALIRDTFFEDYARDFAEDIGAIDRDASWPNDCIDWAKAARELQVDYTPIEFDGVTYWAR